MLKNIHHAAIKSPQAVTQKTENKHECKSNCSCKKQEESDNNSDTTNDDDNDNEQLETDDEEEEEESDMETDGDEEEVEQSDMETDDEDNGSADDCLQVDDISEHLVPVHGFQGGARDMNHMIRVTGEDLLAVKCDRL